MPVVPAELGVGALERRVTARLRLLDAAFHQSISNQYSIGYGPASALYFNGNRIAPEVLVAR
jgi:hypothetical protein